MLVPYKSINELSEEQKKALKNAPLPASGFVMVDGKPVSVTELKSISTPLVRQNLFE